MPVGSHLSSSSNLDLVTRRLAPSALQFQGSLARRDTAEREPTRRLCLHSQETQDSKQTLSPPPFLTRVSLPTQARVTRVLGVALLRRGEVVRGSLLVCFCVKCFLLGLSVPGPIWGPLQVTENRLCPPPCRFGGEDGQSHTPAAGPADGPSAGGERDSVRLTGRPRRLLPQSPTRGCCSAGATPWGGGVRRSFSAPTSPTPHSCSVCSLSEPDVSPRTHP